MGQYTAALREINRRRKRLCHAAGDYWYYAYTDVEYIQILCAVLLSNAWPGDPVWLLIIGPPGCGKSDPLMCLQGHQSVILIGSITSKSLVSGWKGKDQSLMPLLDGKILILKDFTNMLQVPKSERNSAIGKLREAYDGQIGAGHGVGGERNGIKEHNAHFSTIAACTPIYEHYHAVNQQLGERFVTFRFRHVDAMAVARRALHNQGNGVAAKKKLHELFHAFADCQAIMPPIEAVRITGDKEKLLLRTAEFVCRARTHIHRELGSRDVTNEVTVETPSRFMLELSKMARAHAVCYGRLKVHTTDVQIACRVAADSIPNMRFKLIRRLYYHTMRMKKQFPDNARAWYIAVRDMADRFRISPAAMRKHLEDLCLCGITKRRAEDEYGRKVSYALEAPYYKVLRETRICDVVRRQPRRIAPPCNKRPKKK